MARILLLGATGFIGGTVLTTLISKHPKETYILLTRDSSRGTQLKTAYEEKFPGVVIEIVVGCLDDVKVLEKAAEEADIVINAADNDHKASVEALVRGLTRRAASNKPAYLIHTSGSAVLVDDKEYGFGTTIAPIYYNDLDHVTQVTRGLRHDAWHREVDEVVIAAGDEGKIKTSIICPPTVYGIGTGLVAKKTSAQIPLLVTTILKRGKGFTVNKGETVWNNVHVKDLAQLYLNLVEKALAGDEDEQIWGGDSYFFAEAGEHHWGDVTRRLAKISHEKGLIKTPEVDELTPEEVRELVQFENAPKLWGANSKGRALRARKLFRWEPKEEDIWSTLETEVDLHSIK